MKNVRRLTPWLAVFVLLSLLMGGCAAKEAEETNKVVSENEPYKIGVILDVSGASASLGAPERDTVKLIEKELNAKGGINNHPVEIIIRDTESDESKAVIAVKDLIEKEKVIAIVGSSTSGPSMAMIPSATKVAVPMVSTAASIKIVEPVAERKWIFKTANNDSHVALKIIEYLKAKNINKVAFMYMDNAYGDSGKNEFIKAAEQQGITIAAEEKFGAQDKDMTAQLTRIKGKEVQGVVVWAIPPSASIVTTNFKQLGFDIPLIHSHGIGNKKFIELAKDASEGVIFPIGKLIIANELPENDPQKKVLLDYIDAYKAEYNQEPNNFGGYAWDAMQLVIKAIEQSGGDKEKLREALENTKDFAGISGTFNLSTDDHNGLNVDDLVMVEIANGGWRIAK